ncbi:PREDICTED: UDP-glycosyltransferase 79B9-like [Ipomoea nil]|uniref:UDP-glycosyltransferase 79B9-like n=1 Tax=Ipomoea nil TaxID=35883 RepID=UPI00090175D7|nr:PREDICTED: UDP-glycosyltransferase 79B9-like [Ipomoea nil]
MPNNSKLQIAMFPWFAYGHMIPFLHLANEFAKRGHTISFLLPKNVISKLATNNPRSHLITFHALSLPHVPGLAPGAETTADAKDSFVLSSAMDGTKDQVRAILEGVKPDFVFFDFAYWVPDLAPEIGFKTVYFKVMSATTSALKMVMSTSKGRPLTAADILAPPPGYPSSNVTLREHEARKAALFANAHADELRKFFRRSDVGIRNCDLLAVRTVKETEGIYCDYLATQYAKPVLCTGAVLPEPREEESLEDKISIWLANFEAGSVVFCAFGSEWVLEKPQFQQLLLGLEQTNLPFLVALKPPKGTTSVEEAMPEGFQERVQDRGMVYGCWVPQNLILAHRSIGCFVNHCGYGSMWESLMSDCQLVFVPNILDQSLNTRLMADELRVAVEVERDEDGWFSKESICKAVKSVMDRDNQIGCLVRENHRKWKEILTRPGFMSDYVDNFIQYLQGLVYV